MKYFTLDYDPYGVNTYNYFSKHIWNDNGAPSYPEWLLSEWKTRFRVSGIGTLPEYEWQFINESDRTIFALKWS